MWVYKKKLEYPVDIKRRDLKMAKYLMAQYGGPDSELGACLRYLNQRYTMPDDKGKALLTDIGTEEIGHLEIIAAMIYQLMKGASIDELEKAGLGGFYTEPVEKLKKSVDIPIVYSGGITTVDDIKKLNETGVDGIVIGSALYKNKIDFAEALKYQKRI